MRRLQLQSAEASVSLTTSLALLYLAPERTYTLKALLISATTALCFHEALLKHSAFVGRLPSGLSQGTLLIPWLLYALASTPPFEALFLTTLLTGLLTGLISLAVTSWQSPPLQSGLGIGLTAYLVTLLMCLDLLRPFFSWQCLTWMCLMLFCLVLEMQFLPETFSLGEMFVCAELLTALLSYLATRNRLPESFLTADPVTGDLLYWICYAMALSLGLSLCGALAVRQWTVDWIQSLHGLTLQKRRNQIFSLFVHTFSLIFAVLLLRLLSAAVSILSFALETRRRRMLIGYWAALMMIGLWTAHRLRTWAQTVIMRKWFHFLALGLFLPGYWMEPVLLQLCLAAAQILFFFIEAMRLAHLPKVSSIVDQYLGSFTDHRDHGPVIVSHFSLLIGLAVPIWVGPLLRPDAELLSLSGLMSLGIGDAFAAIVGTTCGRSHVVKGLGKSLEGAAACFLSTMMGWTVMSLFWPILLTQLILPTAMAALFEAFSSQNDNLFLPLYYCNMVALESTTLSYDAVDVTGAGVTSAVLSFLPSSTMGTRIYVGNLSTRVTESDLEDEFKKFGMVRNIWVARQPPGFAFVVMEDDRDAEDAIHKMDGLHGWKVEFSHKDTNRRPDRGPPGRTGRDAFRCYECGEPGHLARDCRVRQYRMGRYDRNRDWRRSRSRSYDRYGRRERSFSRGRSPSPPRGRSFSRGRSPSREPYRGNDRHGAETRPRERSRDRSFSRGSFDRARDDDAEKRRSASPAPRD